MSRRETHDNKASGNDPRATDKREDGRLLQQSIRLSDDDWAAIEAMAKNERKITGNNITASGIIRRILRQEIRRRGVGKVEAIVIT